MSKVFNIPVYWQMHGTVGVDAENFYEALHKANEKVSDGDLSPEDVPEHSFVEGTFTVDEDKALADN